MKPHHVIAAMATVVVAVACSSSGSSTTAPIDMATWDVIVVGSGAGGGPLAARLAENGKRVLLLEAGDDVGASLAYEVPAQHALSTEDPARAWSFYVQHHADAAEDAEDSKYVAAQHGILYPRGSALGGSTAVNAMVTVLPSPSDWNRLAELTGDASYRAVRMAPYYDRVREWLPIELADPAMAAGDRVVTGFLFAGARTVSAGTVGDATSLGQLFGPNLDDTLASGEATGFFRMPYATDQGHRRGSRERILGVVAAGHPLTVSTASFVTRVLFDTSGERPRATGVEYKVGHAFYAASAERKDGATFATRTAQAREVILAAGSFNSPQLLTLSGVGDPATMKRLGIDRVLARTGVGQNLQDRYEAGVVAELDAPVPLLASCNLGRENDACLSDWTHGRGVYMTPGFLATALVRSRPELPLADLQVFAVPTDARGYYPGYSAVSARAKNSFSWLILQAHTQGKTGFVVPTSANPALRPHVQMNVFDPANPASKDELAAMVHGIRFVRSIHEEFRKANPDLGFHEVWPGTDKTTDEDLGAFVKRETWGHHVCCTDKMGRDDDASAVVDARFRVIGADGLRVVDASVFPEIPGTFIALPLYMLSEKAADVVFEDLR